LSARPFFSVFFPFFFFFGIFFLILEGGDDLGEFAVTSASAQLRSELRNLIEDDDDDDEAPPPPPASANPTFSTSRDASSTTTTTLTTTKSTTKSKDDDADVAAIVARAVAQTQQQKRDFASQRGGSGSSKHGFNVTDASIGIKSSHGGVSAAASGAGVDGSAAGWVRTPDGELVQTRGGRSVSIASQAELSDIMASLAQARTVDEQIAPSAAGARSALLGRHASVATSIAPSGGATTRKTYASRAFEKSEPIQRSASASSATSAASDGRPSRPTEQTSPVINVDFATLTGTDWNDVLASLDEHRDMIAVPPSSSTGMLSPRGEERRASEPVVEIVYSKLPDMSKPPVPRSVSSPGPSPAPSPRVAAAAAAAATTTAAETRSPRAAASSTHASLSVSAPSVSTSASSLTSSQEVLKQCTRCGSGKVAARVKLDNGKTLALCRSCTLKFKETAMQPQATPVFAQPYDSAYKVPDAWQAVREKLTATLRAAKEDNDDDALLKLKIPSQDALLWSPRAPTPGVRSATLLVTLPDNTTVTVRASSDFTYVDVLRGCAVECGVWQVELFGLCHRLKSSNMTEAWLTTEPFATIGERADSGIDWLAQQPLFFRVKYWKAPKFLIDNRAAHFMAAQAAEAVSSGAWRCSAASAVQLGALRVRLDLGPYDARRHSAAMFTEQRLAQWLPTPLLRSMRASTLSAQLLAAYARVDAEHLPKTATGESEELLLQRFVRIYLKLVRKLPTFGLTLFEATRTDEEKPVPVLLSVAEDGLLMAPSAVAQSLTVFVWANLHSWRVVRDDVFEVEVERYADPNVLRGDTATLLTFQFASAASLARCVDLINGYWLHIADNRDIVLGEALASPRALSTRPADAHADLFFPPSMRAQFDPASSRLELLHDAYQRCTVKRGVMPAERILDTLERHLTDNEPLTRLELLASDFASTGVLGLRAVVEGVSNAMQYAAAPGEPMLNNVQLRDVVMRGVPLDGIQGVRHIGTLLFACRATMRAMTVDACGLGPDGARQLAQYVVDHGQLLHLSLAANAIGASQGVELLRTLTAVTSLVSLQLSHNRFNEKVARAAGAMLAARDNWLRIDLADNELTESGVVAVVSGNAGCARMDEIDLTRVGMSTKGAAALLKLAYKAPVLRRLRMGRNDLHSEKLVELLAPIVAPGTAVPPLATLDLQHASLSPKSLNAILNELSPANANARLEELVLSGNLFDPRAAALLPTALGGLPSLTTLSLARCGLPALAIAAMLVALSGSTPACPKLSALDLADNDLRGDAVEPALRSLIIDRTSLQTLDISGNRLVASGVRSLCEAVCENKTLVTLLLDGIGLGPNALTTLARSLRSHRTFEKLSLRSCGLNDESVARFHEKLMSAPPPKMATLDISFNNDVNLTTLQALHKSLGCRFALVCQTKPAAMSLAHSMRPSKGKMKSSGSDTVKSSTSMTDSGEKQTSSSSSSSTTTAPTTTTTAEPNTEMSKSSSKRKSLFGTTRK
jgi:Ran GTPase-activating protein (RanGAP) involved in mRNA processing and transport/transcription elongation factor Elf1